GGIQFDVPFSSKVRGTFTPKSRMIRLGPNAGIATALEELIHSADFAIGKGRFSSLDPKSGFGEFTERALRDKRNIKFLKGLRETGATTKRYEVFAKLAKGIITG